MIALFSVNLAYGYYPVSPYAYCMGNPIKFVDPNGEEVWIHYNKKRNYCIREECHIREATLLYPIWLII